MTKYLELSCTTKDNEEDYLMIIRKKWGIMLLTILLAISFVGCTGNEQSSSTPKEEATSKPKEETSSKKKEETPAQPKKEDVEAEVKKVIQANAEHLNNEDLNKYMESISSSSLAYEQTKKLSQDLFDKLDIRVEITSIKLVTFSDTAATVEVVQKAKNKVSTPQYKDNITTMTHSLIKENGAWKISNSALKKMTDLDGNELKPN
jgi:hypothetical protein